MIGPWPAFAHALHDAFPMQIDHLNRSLLSFTLFIQDAAQNQIPRPIRRNRAFSPQDF